RRRLVYIPHLNRGIASLHIHDVNGRLLSHGA
ncbi:MAG: hypothetical protein RL593_684, partial [Pseudomonadota bacterium]